MLYKVYLEKRNKRGKFSWKKTLRPYLNFIWTILISLLITAPLLWYFYTNPGTFFGRTSEISVFQQESTFRLMATSIGAALGMYNFYGDPNWRHNVSGDPALMFAEGALFLIGIVLVIRYLLIKQRAAKDVVQFKTNYILLLALFVVMILPAGLSYSPGGIPHALRTLNTAPAVFVFAALAAALIYYKALPKIKDKKKTTFAISILILTSIAAGNFNKYFYQWGMNKNVKYEYHEDYANLSKFINANAAQGAEVLIVDNSVEVEFFTLERKNVLRVSQFDWQTLVGIRPDLLAFSNFGQFNENNYIRRGLQFSGWKEMEGLNFGEGSGDIKVFTKDEISNF